MLSTISTPPNFQKVLIEIIWIAASTTEPRKKNILEPGEPNFEPVIIISSAQWAFDLRTSPVRRPPGRQRTRVSRVVNHQQHRQHHQQVVVADVVVVVVVAVAVAVAVVAVAVVVGMGGKRFPNSMYTNLRSTAPQLLLLLTS